MKFLVDVQLPKGLCVGLAMRGHEAIFVGDILGLKAGDDAIAKFAAEEGWILVTKDGDFAALPMPDRLRIVWLRLGNATNRRLIDWLEPRWNDIELALNAGDTLVEVQ
jgi:predicted nuclease of predicted toxin-antitoxin system